MSKLRSINTAIWSDSWFEELNPTAKLLFIYLITNEKNNMLGVYEITLRKISFDTGIDKTTIEKALKEFESIRKVRFIDNHIMLPNFIKHQSYNTNMKKSAISTYNDLPDGLKIKGYNSVDAQDISKGFISLCEAFGILRKVEVEVEGEGEGETKPKTWKNNFELYKEDLRIAYKELLQDKEFIKKLSHAFPSMNVIKSIENSFVLYWSTDDGWKRKIKAKGNLINWKTTIQNSIKINAVYNQKSDVENTQVQQKSEIYPSLSK